jgi:hypothetical protein
MPAFTGGNLVALLEREPGKVHLMVGNAGRVVLCFREWSQKGWSYCPLGLYSQGNGYWVRYANADTELDLTEWHDVHGIWTDAGEVPNGEAVMDQAAKVWAKHYKNEEGTTASQHFLADVFAQAAVKENGDIQLGLKWVMDYLRRIVAVESVFGCQKFMLCNEKVHATGAFLRSGEPVTELLLGDDTEVVEGCRVFLGDKNEINQQGGVDVSFGSRIQQESRGGFYKYFETKGHILVIIELSRTFTGAIYFDMIACDAPTLLRLLDSGMLWNHGEDVPKVTKNPHWNRYINEGKEPGDEDYIHRFGRPYTDKVIECDGKLLLRNSLGAYHGKLNKKTTQDLHVNDFIACARTGRFPGCVFVEDAKPETAMAALLSVSALGGGAQPRSNQRLRFDTTRACRDARTMAQCREGLRATPCPISDENGLYLPDWGARLHLEAVDATSYRDARMRGGRD